MIQKVAQIVRGRVNDLQIEVLSSIEGHTNLFDREMSGSDDREAHPAPPSLGERPFDGCCLNRGFGEDVDFRPERAYKVARELSIRDQEHHLNTVEMATYAYDPCLSCAAHWLDRQIPVVLNIIGAGQVTPCTEVKS